MPQGLLDELMQEGATEFQDIEGGGVGEGEGAQDVSEKIESEDQVSKHLFLNYYHKLV